MTWCLAKSLDTLRSQMNRNVPSRSKASDGTIGDAAHASRSSDHNPWVKDGATGVVTALDITHDPANGVDIQKLADALVASRDARIKYIIGNGRIVSGSGRKQPAGQWRKYSGSNAHTRHVHISVKASKAQYDDTRDWSLPGRAATPAMKPQQSVLKCGSKGPFVSELQRNLAALGYAAGTADGVFGEKTEAADKVFQKARGLTVDGWADPRTIEAIGKALAEKAVKPKIEKLEQVLPAVEKEVKKEERRRRWQWMTVVPLTGIATSFRNYPEFAWPAAGSVVVVAAVAIVGGRRLVRRVKGIVAEVKG